MSHSSVPGRGVGADFVQDLPIFQRCQRAPSSARMASRSSAVGARFTALSVSSALSSKVRRVSVRSVGMCFGGMVRVPWRHILTEDRGTCNHRATSVIETSRRSSRVRSCKGVARRQGVVIPRREGRHVGHRQAPLSSVPTGENKGIEEENRRKTFLHAVVWASR